MKIRLKVLKGKCEARKLPRPDGFYYMGRGEDCHFRLADPEAAERHCAIRVGKRRILMQVLGDQSALVNGLAVSARCELSDGDVITVGSTKFCLLLVESTPKDPLAGDVSEWLSQEDERERQLRELDPDARRYALSQQGSQPESTSASDSSAVAEAPAEEKKPVKKPPQKLPPAAPRPAAPSSQHAASEVLSQMFQRPPRDKRN